MLSAIARQPAWPVADFHTIAEIRLIVRIAVDPVCHHCHHSSNECANF